MKKILDTTAQVKSVKTNLILEYDKIVIGSDLKAVLFAFNNELPLLYSQARRPFRFDYLHSSVDLTCLKMESGTHALSTHTGNINIGQPKELLWEKLLFLLALSGLAPLSNVCESMRHSGDRLICSNEYSKIAEIKFNHCYYFGDDNCTGLVTQKIVADPVHICYDWIAFNRGGKHEIDLIETPDDFVKQVWFYPTDRIDGNSPVKDACLVSRLTDEQLLDFNYSQTMARFKMIAEMESRGMKGLFNGYSPTGNPKYYKFRTTSMGRTRCPQLERSQPSVETVEVPEIKEEDLLKDLSAACVGYNRLLENL